MKFTFDVMYKGKIIGKKSCIAPSLEAFDFYIQDKILRHVKRGTGFTFLTNGFSISA